MGKFIEENRPFIFKKYDEPTLTRDIESYLNGKGHLNKTLNQYFEEIIFSCCGKKSKISPMDVLYDDKKIEEIFDYIKTKPKFYNGNDVTNLKSFFRNAVSWVRKVANFDPCEARNIYYRYFQEYKDKNLFILDTSCGFGSRMSASLLYGNNYIGFDPNVSLVEKLYEYYDFLCKSGFVKRDQIFKVYSHGSEVFEKDLVDKFDVMFTSPPYFNLEKYSDDNSESTSNYNNYDLWVKKFVNPTVYNIYQYLKVGGIAMINIKNIDKKEPCYDSFYNAFMKNGFEFIECFDMKILSKKQYGKRFDDEKGVIKPTEPVMSFIKR